MDRWLLSGLVLAVSLPLAASCSDDGNLFGSPPTGGTGGSGGSGATTTTSSTEGGGGFGASGASTATGGYAGTGGGVGGTGGDVCVPTVEEVGLPELDLLIMVDRSASMNSENRWPDMVAAVTGFANEPRAPGTRVALNYHPALPYGQECVVAAYDPPSLPWTAVPQDGAGVAASINAESPDAMSPWSSIIEGSLQFATAEQDQTPERVVAAVFTVDSDPNTCDMVVANIASIAEAALNYNGVHTYAIAMSSYFTLANVSMVAAAGGTGQALDLTASGATSQLQSIFNQIHHRAVPCEIPLPDSPSPPDPDEVNLVYSPGGANPDILPRRDSEPHCADGPGWYYDHPGNPTTIILCLPNCDDIKEDTAPLLELELGCPTVEG